MYHRIRGWSFYVLWAIVLHCAYSLYFHVMAREFACCLFVTHFEHCHSMPLLLCMNTGLRALQRCVETLLAAFGSFGDQVNIVVLPIVTVHQPFIVIACSRKIATNSLLLVYCGLVANSTLDAHAHVWWSWHEYTNCYLAATFVFIFPYSSRFTHRMGHIISIVFFLLWAA